MINYNKLVRDNVPSIIKESNKECRTKVLSEVDYELELRKKLIEEATELYNAKNKEEKILELADIYEVIEYILMTNHISKYEVDEKRIKKNMEKGSFEDKIFLEYVN